MLQMDRRACLIAALLMALALSITAIGNELVRRAAQQASRKSRRLLLGAEQRLFVTQFPDAPSVAEFAADLSDEELAGWHRMPRYTATGSLLTCLSRELREELHAWHAEATRHPEPNSGHLTGHIELANLAGSPLERRLREYLQDLMEQWTGEHELEWSNSYGPRTYHRGAKLAAHGDRIATHALSAIVYIGEEESIQPWPLQFVHVGAKEQDKVQLAVFSFEQDVLLYESTQPHGRIWPLQGEAYSAVFFHWRPRGWTEAAAALTGY